MLYRILSYYNILLLFIIYIYIYIYWDVQEAGHETPRFSTDPLMATLAHFDTDADLSQRIQTLFQVGEIFVFLIYEIKYYSYYINM